MKSSDVKFDPWVYQLAEQVHNYELAGVVEMSKDNIIIHNDPKDV